MAHRKLAISGLFLLLLTLPSAAQVLGRRGSTLGQTITLRGRVVDAETNSAVLQARIRLSSSGVARTAVGGDFEFDELPARANYEITVEADGYQDVREMLDPSVEATGFVVIAMHRFRGRERALGSKVTVRLLQLPGAAQEAFLKGMDCLYGKHDPAGSLPFFQETLKLAPKFYEAQYQAGMAYRSLGRAPESEAAFAGAAAASEGHYSPAQFALASVLSDRRKFAEAEVTARNGLQGEDDSGPGHYELARALLGQGKSGEAEKEARTTLARTRNLPQTHLLLAAIYDGRDDPEHAVRELDLYLRDVPKGGVSDSVRALRLDLQRKLLASK